MSTESQVLIEVLATIFLFLWSFAGFFYMMIALDFKLEGALLNKVLFLFLVSGPIGIFIFICINCAIGMGHLLHFIMVKLDINQ
jgi:hypothetical protein